MLSLSSIIRRLLTENQPVLTEFTYTVLSLALGESYCKTGLSGTTFILLLKTNANKNYSLRYGYAGSHMWSQLHSLLVKGLSFELSPKPFNSLGDLGHLQLALGGGH